MLNYLRYFGKILIWMVTLVSGLFSIMRESLNIAFPEMAKSQSSLWHWMLIAFIISSFYLLIMQHRKISSLEKRLDKSSPYFNTDFDVLAVAPAGDDESDSVIIIMATIKNTGAPSIISDIKVAVKTESGEILGEDIVLGQGPMFLEGEGLKITVKEEDNLPRKGISEPIPTGGAVHGWHIVLARSITRGKIYNKQTTIILSYEDVIGKLYTSEKIMNDAVSKLIDGTKLQKHIT
jgi:hypothetical protein